VEKLHDTLVFNNAVVDEWSFNRIEPSVHEMQFTLKAVLSEELAEALRCSSIYREEDTKVITLTHKLKDTEILLPTPGLAGELTSFFPDSIYGFKATQDDGECSIACSVRVSSRVDELHEIFKAYENAIAVTVKPRQGELFDGGTRVEMSEGTQKNGGDLFGAQENNCVDCNNDIPFAEGSTDTHASGQPCTDAPMPGPVLVTVREAAGKTPGRRGKKAARRGDSETLLTEDELKTWNSLRAEGGQAPMDMDAAIAILTKNDEPTRTRMLARVRAARMDVADEVTIQ
jgi:hypothetical protein